MRRIHHLLFPALSLAVAAAAAAQHTPEEALRTLQEGNRRYATGRSVPQPVGQGVRRTLARGQSPFAVVVTCADSRVPPEHLFNVGLGELVVVRTAGHVLGAEAIASIEHAVERLDVPLCVVLGHEHCDVIAAAERRGAGDQAHAPRSDAIAHLLERIEPALRKAHGRELGGADLLAACEEEHAHQTVATCLRQSALLRRYAAVGRFRMVAARYHTSGEVEWLPHRPLPDDQDAERPLLPGTVPSGLPPHVALRMLRAGHSRFLGDRRPAPDLSPERRAALSEGQQPLAIVVTDSDSRVAPEHVFDAGLGDLYVVRVAGGAMTDETLASIEFAATRFGASLLVFLSHDRSEALAAAAEHPTEKELTPNQRALLRRLEPAVAEAREHGGSDLLVRAAQTNAARALHEVRARSRVLRQLEAEGRFAMLAGLYEVATGDLSWLKMAAEPVARAGGHDGHEGPAHEDHGHEDHGHAVAHAEPHAPAGHGHEHAGGDHAAAHHDDPTHGHDDRAHGAEPHHDLPVIDLHAAPLGETSSHGDAHGDGHDAHGHGGHGHEDGHGAPAAEHGHDEPHGAAPLARWLDPVVLVGLVGMSSLLFAAVLALRGKA